MSTIKASRTAQIHEKKEKNEWLVIVYLWVFGLAVLGYILSHLGLLPISHTYHWTSGILDGVLGFLVGWIWYRCGEMCFSQFDTGRTTVFLYQLFTIA